MNSRCSICNAVSSPELALVPSESKRQNFHIDPYDRTAMLCHDCYSDIAHVSEEWAQEDSLDEEEEWNP